MVKEVRITAKVDCSLVVREAAALGWHDDATTSPRADGTGASRVANILRATVSCISYVINAVTFIYPRSFLKRGGAFGISSTSAEARSRELDLVGLPL